MNELEHKLLYIYWKKDAEKVYLLIDEFQNKYDEFKKHRKVSPSNCVRVDFMDENTYTYSEKGYWRRLYCKDNGKYTIYISNIYNDKVNELCKIGEYESEGTKSKHIVNDLFWKEFGVTEKKAFGYSDGELINRCVPKSLYYINNRYSNKNLNHVSKVDFSSNYPSNLIGDLPDWHHKIILKGTWKPTKEYPFAYYINSGHVAEYNRFDTHKWLNNEIKECLFNYEKLNIINDMDDVTILCAKSKYNFNNVVNTIYDARIKGIKIDGVDPKLVINQTIGCMHRKDVENATYKLYHIAAIVLGRASQCVLDVYNKLRSYGVTVLQMVVDGIIYNAPGEIGEHKKYLGALKQEVTDAKFRMRGINAYMFFDQNDNFIQERHGAYNADIETSRLKDIDKWRKVNK